MNACEMMVLQKEMESETQFLSCMSIRDCTVTKIMFELMFIKVTHTKS